MVREYIEAFKKKFLCCHEWERIQQNEIFWNEKDKHPALVEIIFLCKKCGKFKKIKT